MGGGEGGTTNRGEGKLNTQQLKTIPWSRLEEVAQFKLNTHGQLADNRRGSFVMTLAGSIRGGTAAAGTEIGSIIVRIAGMTQL